VFHQLFPPSPTRRSSDLSIQAFVLGPFELRAGGTRISDRGWRTSKAKELFALLLLDRQRAVSRDELVAQLWPETDPASALSNFQDRKSTRLNSSHGSISY